MISVCKLPGGMCQKPPSQDVLHESRSEKFCQVCQFWKMERFIRRVAACRPATLLEKDSIVASCEFAELFIAAIL